MVKTGIIPARLLDNENRLTPFLSGDRFVYVKGNFSSVLHPSAILGGGVVNARSFINPSMKPA